MDNRLTAQVCLRDAWPAPETAECCGWILRGGRGGYNRANSVWTGRFSGDLATAIRQAESFYRQRHLRPRFQILDVTEPAGLDQELAGRHYWSELVCTDMVKAVVDGTEPPPEVSVTEEAGADWLGLYCAEQPPEKMAELPRILAQLPRRRGFVLCRRDGLPAGVALVARVGDDAAVDCVLTKPSFRRRGVGRSILQAAGAWAAREGAQRLVLSVVDGNAPAVALYRGLGYLPLSGYHYRVGAA